MRRLHHFVYLLAGGGLYLSVDGRLYCLGPWKLPMALWKSRMPVQMSNRCPFVPLVIASR